MKAIAYQKVDSALVPCEPEVATHVWIELPGPLPSRVLPVVSKGSRDKASKDRKEPVWSWNGDVEKPTFKPSILSRVPGVCDCCHSWVTDGKVQFLGDCTHEFAGQTLDLLEVEE